MFSVLICVSLFFPLVTAGTAKRAYRRWLLQLVCWFSRPKVSSVPGYSCQVPDGQSLEDFQTIDFRTDAGWLSWAKIKFIDSNKNIKVEYLVKQFGGEAKRRRKYETVELFSGRIAPLGSFGDRSLEVTILDGENKSNLNPAPLIKLRDYPGDEPVEGVPPFKNLVYQLERDWTVIFRELEVPLPDVELMIASESGEKLHVSGMYLETGERFSGRAVYQCGPRFLLWDVQEKRWIITYELPINDDNILFEGVIAYNTISSLTADLLSGPWYVRKQSMTEGFSKVYNTTVRAIPARDVKQKLFYPGTETVVNNQTYELNNGVIMPRLGVGTGGLQHDFEAIKWAVQVGYRLIDIGPSGDQAYGNQEIIAEVLRQRGMPPRSDLFLALKIQCHGYHNAIWEVYQALSIIGTDYLDLIVIHKSSCQTWCNPWQDTWKAMEHLYRKGRARSLGVTFDYPTILELMEMKSKDVPLSVVRTSFSEGLGSAQLGTVDELKFVMLLQGVGYHVQIYSPFGGEKSWTLLEGVGGADSVIKSILKQGMSLIVRSEKLNHIIMNFHQD